MNSHQSLHLFKLTLLFTFLLILNSQAQYKVIEGIPSVVDFSIHLRDWDGFGFNYVETAQTDNYGINPQEYGGFSLLNDNQKNEIIDLIFGEDGLKISLVKMFLDPWHQATPDAPFNHERTASHMIEFVTAGHEKIKSWGGNFAVITTLYGPPPWATQQKFLGGRDLDPNMQDALANYMIDWVKFLKKEKDIPVRYLSIHNEGEDWVRWAWDGTKKGIFDYNMYWPNEQINEWLKFMPGKLKKAGLSDVAVTNGEPSNWHRFSTWGIAEALYDDDEALQNLEIVTSHGFYGETSMKRWYADHRSAGIDLLRQKRPGLHAWVTSTGWGNMDALFIREIHGNIYGAKVNALIPWAGIQRPVQWEGGDPNKSSAIRVLEDSTFQVLKGYYFYKQVSRAGQAGMAVARATSADTQGQLMAFASNSTPNPNAFVVINWDDKWDKKFDIKIRGASATRFHGYRTDTQDENYMDIGIIEVKDGQFRYTAPIGTVTTFYELN